jgi:ATP-dependent DNA ligase
MAGICAGSRLKGELAGSQLSLLFNECFEEDGAIVYREACKLGCEGIVSKRASARPIARRDPRIG